MTSSPAAHPPNRRRDFPAVLRVVLMLVIVICAGLYFYYLLAQDLSNPMPVQGVLTESTCRPSAISKKGTQTEIPVLLNVYEFPSRSKDVALQKKGRPTLDQITEYVSLATNEECFAAAKRQEIGSKRTIWAGEDELGKRFRARFTEHREYPPLALLWLPGCISALVLLIWRRAAR